MPDYLEISGRVRTIAYDGVVVEAQEVKDLLKNKSQQEINADVDNELGDRYTKEETYSKEQLDELITTPDVNYVSVVATNATTAVTDVLPATGEANTIYRVGNWNGTQYDPTMYALFAWNGTTYVCLAVRSFVGEVYDISVNHPDGQGNPTPYADLAAALGTNGANIPADIRRGGMSIKFIKGTVQSSDNKYVQYFLTKNVWSANEADWEKMNLEYEVSQLDQEMFGKEVNLYPNMAVANKAHKVISNQPDVPGNNVYRIIGHSSYETVLYQWDISNHIGCELVLSQSAMQSYYACIVDENFIMPSGNADFQALLGFTENCIIPNGAKYLLLAWNDAYPNATITIKKEGVVEQLEGSLNELETSVGNLNNLDTNNKDNLVSAINEVNGISEITGKEGVVEVSLNPDTYIGIDDRISTSLPLIPLDGVMKVSVCTVMSYATTYDMLGFYDASDNLIEALGYSDFTRPGNKLNVVTDYAVPAGSVGMRICAWAQANYDEQKANLYIKLYKEGIVGGIIGDNLKLKTTNKTNIVSAINEVVDDINEVVDDINPLFAEILNSGNKTQFYEHCSMDEDYFTISSSLTTNMVVWNVGCNRYIKLNDYENVVCVVATETNPVRDSGGTTSMEQFNPELIFKRASVHVPVSHFTMPTNKGYLCICYNQTANIDTLVSVPNLEERVAQVERSNINVFQGKTVSFLGDSLFNNGPRVCEYFALLSGMSFVNRERGVLSKGGTPTLAAYDTENCGQMRARKLESLDLEIPDILVIENVNDGWRSGEGPYTEDDINNLIPFMLDEWHDVQSGGDSKQDAIDYFANNFNTIVGSITPKLGTMIRVSYGTQTYRITITNAASANGDASIVIGGTSYPVTLTTSDSVEHIAELFAAFNFNGFSVNYSQGNAYFDLLRDGSGTDIPTYNAGNTGSSASITEISSYQYVGYCYYANSVSDWQNSNKWINVNELPLMAQYKGLVKYLCATFPDMWVYWMFAPRYDNDSMRVIYDGLRTALPLWGIPYLDVEWNCGINEWNWTNYMTGVHANQYDKGALRWAETMVKCLI